MSELHKSCAFTFCSSQDFREHFLPTQPEEVQAFFSEHPELEPTDVDEYLNILELNGFEDQFISDLSETLPLRPPQEGEDAFRLLRLEEIARHPVSLGMSYLGGTLVRLHRDHAEGLSLPFYFAQQGAMVLASHDPEGPWDQIAHAALFLDLKGLCDNALRRGSIQFVTEFAAGTAYLLESQQRELAWLAAGASFVQNVAEGRDVLPSFSSAMPEPQMNTNMSLVAMMIPGIAHTLWKGVTAPAAAMWDVSQGLYDGSLWKMEHPADLLAEKITAGMHAGVLVYCLGRGVQSLGAMRGVAPRPAMRAIPLKNGTELLVPKRASAPKSSAEIFEHPVAREPAPVSPEPRPGYNPYASDPTLGPVVHQSEILMEDTHFASGHLHAWKATDAGWVRQVYKPVPDTSGLYWEVRTATQTPIPFESAPATAAQPPRYSPPVSQEPLVTELPGDGVRVEGGFLHPWKGRSHVSTGELLPLRERVVTRVDQAVDELLGPEESSRPLQRWQEPLTDAVGAPMYQPPAQGIAASFVGPMILSGVSSAGSTAEALWQTVTDVASQHPDAALLIGAAVAVTGAVAAARGILLSERARQMEMVQEPRGDSRIPRLREILRQDKTALASIIQLAESSQNESKLRGLSGTEKAFQVLERLRASKTDVSARELVELASQFANKGDSLSAAVVLDVLITSLETAGNTALAARMTVKYHQMADHYLGNLNQSFSFTAPEAQALMYLYRRGVYDLSQFGRVLDSKSPDEPAFGFRSANGNLYLESQYAVGEEKGRIQFQIYRTPSGDLMPGIHMLYADPKRPGAAMRLAKSLVTTFQNVLGARQLVLTSINEEGHYFWPRLGARPLSEDEMGSYGLRTVFPNQGNVTPDQINFAYREAVAHEVETNPDKYGLTEDAARAFAVDLRASAQDATSVARIRFNAGEPARQVSPLAEITRKGDPRQSTPFEVYLEDNLGLEPVYHGILDLDLFGAPDGSARTRVSEAHSPDRTDSPTAEIPISPEDLAAGRTHAGAAYYNPERPYPEMPRALSDRLSRLTREDSFVKLDDRRVLFSRNERGSYQVTSLDSEGFIIIGSDGSLKACGEKGYRHAYQNLGTHVAEVSEESQVVLNEGDVILFPPFGRENGFVWRSPQHAVETQAIPQRAAAPKPKSEPSASQGHPWTIDPSTATAAPKGFMKQLRYLLEWSEDYGEAYGPYLGLNLAVSIMEDVNVAPSSNGPYRVYNNRGQLIYQVEAKTIRVRDGYLDEAQFTGKARSCALHEGDIIEFPNGRRIIFSLKPLEVNPFAVGQEVFIDGRRKKGVWVVSGQRPDGRIRLEQKSTTESGSRSSRSVAEFPEDLAAVGEVPGSDEFVIPPPPPSSTGSEAAASAPVSQRPWWKFWE